MDLGYALVCPAAYLLNGATKFAVNAVRARRFAFDQMGLGGFPSTHTAVASGPAWLIAISGDINTPAFAVSLGLLLIVVLDATGLRRKVEDVNRLLRDELPDSTAAQRLRVRIGHTPAEVLGGLVIGAVAALLIAVAVS